MKRTRIHAAIALVLLLAVVFGCMFAADRIQRGNGTIAVTEGWIETDVGDLMYKLYTPETATAANPAYAIELARRGAVVLCLDEYGHGATTAGLVNRGYVNHKVTVNYGEDSAEDGTFKTIGGPTRYKVMMNFSNLSFFDKHYSTDEDGNAITDSSAGGNYAYALLAAMDNVDPTRLAISGHSAAQTWNRRPSCCSAVSCFETAHMILRIFTSIMSCFCRQSTTSSAISAITKISWMIRCSAANYARSFSDALRTKLRGIRPMAASPMAQPAGWSF